jgi:hypothetical protein
MAGGLRQPQHVLARLLRCISALSSARHYTPKSLRCQPLPSMPGEEASDADQRSQRRLLLFLLLLFLVLRSD